MQDKEIIYDKLKFLVEQYNMEYKFTTNGKENYYRFSNSNGCLMYYEWPQFGDKDFYIAIKNSPERRIDIFQDNSDLLSEWHKKHSGIKWWFKDKRFDYWDLISLILKKQINENGTLFGLKI